MRAVRIDLITLFADACEPYLEASIVGRARRRGLATIACHDPRRWAGGRHRKVDDRPFGGGPGMVLAAPPLAGCLDHVLAQSAAPRLLVTDARGRPFDQALARELATTAHVVVLCGHYEGIDQRIYDLYRPEPFSIGPYVLSGGELAALVVADAVVRLLPGALGNASSAVEETHTPGHGDDHPCWTRPPEFRDLRPPEVLLSGDHAAVERWRAGRRSP
jgi:tRNA (guanine37-N1)-methyltransferase